VSLKKPPEGPSSGRVARRTATAAPCSALRPPRASTSEGEHLRAVFWRNLIEDPGPLAPLDEADVRTLAGLLELTEP
jgi:hypothetical protein